MKTLQDVIDDLVPRVDRHWTSYGMPVFELPVERLMETVTRLKDEHGFNLFLDVTAVDWPERQPRFDVVYHFLSRSLNARVRLKVRVPEEAASVPTLTALYGSAGFMEREAHEMYGIDFPGHGDLRPILLYEGFEGHPLRKDYPMDLEQPTVPYRK